MNNSLNSQNPTALKDLGDWNLAALASGSLLAILEWLFAWHGSTGLSFAAILTGFFAFLSLWLIISGLWGLGSALILWAVTGRPTALPLLLKSTDFAKKSWQERSTCADRPRLATLLSALLGLFLFLIAAILAPAHLIATRNEPLIIAAVSLVLQTSFALAAFLLAMTLRRAILAISHLLGPRWPRHLNAPHLLLLLFLLAILAMGALLFFAPDFLLAIEGPTFLLLAAALLLHPAIALFLSRHSLSLPRLLPSALLSAPLIGLLLFTAFSAHADARRLIVLHGHPTAFAFSALQNSLAMERILHLQDCIPVDPDGRVNRECLHPDFHRPFHRPEAPSYTAPNFEEPPSFVLITWDSVRVDRLGFMGHRRDTTPNLDRFVEKSLLFERAFAQDSGTGPSFWSLMAGQTPFQVRLHDAHRFPPRIDDDEEMLGELLSAAGYHVEALMCGVVFERPRWEGIRRGFSSFPNLCGDEKANLAPMVADPALATIERLKKNDQPFFLWIHFYDPHHPYNSHPEIGFGSSTLDRYDEELRYADHYTGKVLDALLKAGQTRPIYTFFSADHGENFNEHGSDPHARNLYRIVTQVPKFVHGPQISPGRISTPVALNDIHPTILELAGLPIPEKVSMVSQAPVLFGAPPDPTRMVFQENSYSRPRRHTRAVVFDRYHYIMDLTTGLDEFYDYVDDPLQRRNLLGAGLPQEEIARQALFRFLQTSTIPEGLR